MELNPVYKELVYKSLTAPNRGLSITPGVMKSAYRFVVNNTTSMGTKGQNDEFADRESRRGDQISLLEAKFDKVIDDSNLPTTIDYFNHNNINPEIVLIGKFKNRVISHRYIEEPISPGSKEKKKITDVTLTFIKDEPGAGQVTKTLKYSDRYGVKSAERLYTLKAGITLDNDDKIIMQKVGVYKGGRKTRRQNRKYRKTKKNKKRSKSQ